MPSPDRGSVWIVDLGMVAKVRPCLVLSVATDPQDRVLVTLVPRTTSVQRTRFEVAAQLRFLHPRGVFDAKQIATVPEVKLIRQLGDLQICQRIKINVPVRSGDLLSVSAARSTLPIFPRSS
jgi:mRNA interferase MazF